MEKEKMYMTKKILNITLEIIYLLTGEDYSVVKKSSKDVESTSRCQLMGGMRRTLRCTTVIPCRSLVHDNEQKVLELANKIIRLLTIEDQSLGEENTDSEEETYVRVELQCKEEEIPKDVAAGNSPHIHPGPMERNTYPEDPGIHLRSTMVKTVNRCPEAVRRLEETSMSGLLL